MDPSIFVRPTSDQPRPQAKRPVVSVVMPFAGGRFEAAEATATLLSLELEPRDELILADNSGIAEGVPGVRVVTAIRERSPAHARNVGAAAAGGEWILFLDADCRPRRDLLRAYFADPVAETVGALAGEVRAVVEPEHVVNGSAASGAMTRAPTFVPRRAARSRPPLAARYGAARSFLSQRQHLAHPYRPRAVAANLLVRRTAFEQVGGFYEGLRAAEDTDFTWRLQQTGWRLELRPEAWVEHRYRTTLTELRRQWRGYAAGRAWLARRYEGFIPERPLSRGLARARRGLDSRRRRRIAPGSPAPLCDGAGRLERGKYLAIDALLALEESAGLLLSNRPVAADRIPSSTGQAHVVFVADHFPSPGDPLLELAGALEAARVEAAGRPAVIPSAAHALRIHYREDDGLVERLASLVRVFLSHPLRCARDVLAHRKYEASLISLAPAVRRLERDPGARVQPLGGGEAATVARRLAALAGRRSG